MNIPQDNPQLAGGVEWLCEAPPGTLREADDLFSLRRDLNVGTVATKLAEFINLDETDSRDVISDGQMNLRGGESPAELYTHGLLWIIDNRPEDDTMTDHNGPIRVAISRIENGSPLVIAFNFFSNEVVLKKRCYSREKVIVSGLDIAVVDGVPNASRERFDVSFNFGHPSEAIRTLVNRSKENFMENDGPIETFELLASAAAMLIDGNEKKTNKDWQNDHTANAKFRKLFMIVSEDVWGIVAANYGEIDHNDMWKKFSLQMSENAFYWSNVATRAKQIELY